MENLLNDSNTNPMFNVENWFIHKIRESGMIVLRSTQKTPGVATIKFVDAKGNDMSCYNPNGDDVYFAVACLRYDTGKKDKNGDAIKATRDAKALARLRHTKSGEKVFKVGNEPLRADGQPLFKCCGKMTTRDIKNKQGKVIRKETSESLQWLAFNNA
jgi:hypothetical protein